MMDQNIGENDFMPKVTSGRVMFSKTVQERQFEPAHAEVELSFELQESEVLKEVIAEMEAFVKEEALSMVEIEQDRNSRRRR